MPASQDQKIQATTSVGFFETMGTWEKESQYSAMVAWLQSMDPWIDEGPLWAWATGTGYWDTWRNLRNRLDAATPSKAARVANAAPQSVVTAAVGGAGEGLKEGAADLAEAAGKVAEVASDTVKNADKILLAFLILAGVVVASRIWSMRGA